MDALCCSKGVGYRTSDAATSSRDKGEIDLHIRIRCGIRSEGAYAVEQCLQKNHETGHKNQDDDQANPPILGDCISQDSV
jgi:hypothetical protein